MTELLRRNSHSIAFVGSNARAMQLRDAARWVGEEHRSRGL
jgi:hypothetical protein